MAVKKKVKLKKGAFQILFWIVSIVFILIILCIFIIKFVVGSINHNDNLKMGEYIIENNDTENGLYRVDSNYVFKGNDSFNYVKYGNMIFRIIRIYKDGSMDIVLDNKINSLYYGDDYNYIESDIHKYINDEFLSFIDIKDLNKTPLCMDKIEDINSISCNRIDFSSYVRLPSLIDYMDSLDGADTYLNNGTLLSSYSSNYVWNIDDGISKTSIENPLYVYPVITLNNKVQYISGDGSLENPYIINNNSYVGAYVLIDNDRYVVIDEDNGKIKLMLVTDSFLFRKKYDSKILDYLNDDYYYSLSYKKILEKFNISFGNYDKDYEKTTSKKKKVYVGIPTISDIKIDDSVVDYYLINSKSDDEIYYYNNGLKVISKDISMKLRSVIMIKKSKISTGDGSYDNPYVVEVK